MEGTKKTPEERIQLLKENLGSKFKDEAKLVIRDGKVLKGKESEEHFDTQLNKLTFARETIYPLNYNQFKTEFPKTIELVSKVEGSDVIDGINNGYVLNGWSERNNVDEIIENIKENIEDQEQADAEILLREEVFNEIKKMKEAFQIDWCADLFLKTWKIQEGIRVWKILISEKGETLAKKRIKTIEDCGGLPFLELLQKEVYGE